MLNNQNCREKIDSGWLSVWIKIDGRAVPVCQVNAAGAIRIPTRAHGQKRWAVITLETLVATLANKGERAIVWENLELKEIKK